MHKCNNFKILNVNLNKNTNYENSQPFKNNFKFITIIISQNKLS